MNWLYQVLSSQQFPQIYLLNKNIDVNDVRLTVEGMNYHFYHLNGSTILSEKDFFEEAANVFAFPKVKVGNWDALLDRFRNIPWLPFPRAEDTAKGTFILYDRCYLFAMNNPVSFATACNYIEQMQEESWYYFQDRIYFVLCGDQSYMPPNVLVHGEWQRFVILM